MAPWDFFRGVFFFINILIYVTNPYEPMNIY